MNLQDLTTLLDYSHSDDVAVRKKIRNIGARGAPQWALIQIQPGYGSFSDVFR
jgi:hypothetical protein